MKLKILDRIEEGNSYCLLCKTSLLEYTSSIPENFRDFVIQRGIVSNKFLDRLWETIYEKQHIPSIVLTTDNSPNINDNNKLLKLDGPFRILDGLQRSNRLNIILKTIEFIQNDSFEDDTDTALARIARKYSKEIKEIGSNAKLFTSILKSQRTQGDLKPLLSENHIWIEIWVNLSDDLKIKKMLILNAGHKSVNIKHQIELLFLNYYDKFANALNGYTIYREKNKPTINYSKDRKSGQFHFSHLISSLESLNANKPISTNADYSAERTFSENEEETLVEIDAKLFDAFGRVLMKLDQNLTCEIGLKWLGREVVLVGIFGAIGKFGKENGTSKIETLLIFEGKIAEYAHFINLQDFESQRNNLEMSKVNIGNVNKRATYNFTYDFLRGEVTQEADWKVYFRVDGLSR